MTEAYPMIENWYEHHDKGQMFRVIAFDEDEGVIEIQHFDGDVEELTLDEWNAMNIAPCEEPENWLGAIDVGEEDDLGTEITDTDEEDWSDSFQEVHLEEESRDEDEG